MTQPAETRPDPPATAPMDPILDAPVYRSERSTGPTNGGERRPPIIPAPREEPQVEPAPPDEPEPEAPAPKPPVRQPQIDKYLRQGRPTSDYETWADIRRQVAVRAFEFLCNHLLAAWNRRNTEPLGPHLVAFHYTVPDSSRAAGWFSVRTATRAVLASEEGTGSPAQLLRALVVVAQTYWERDSELDLRRNMCQRVERMSRDAWFLGVTISNLHAFDTPGHEQVAEVVNPRDLVGQAVTRFVVGTTMITTRLPVGSFDRRAVQTTDPLDYLSAGYYQGQFDLQSIPWSILPHSMVPTIITNDVDRWLTRLCAWGQAAHNHGEVPPYTDDDTGTIYR